MWFVFLFVCLFRLVYGFSRRIIITSVIVCNSTCPRLLLLLRRSSCLIIRNPASFCCHQFLLLCTVQCNTFCKKLIREKGVLSVLCSSMYVSGGALLCWSGSHGKNIACHLEYDSFGFVEFVKILVPNPPKSHFLPRFPPFCPSLIQLPHPIGTQAPRKKGY